MIWKIPLIFFITFCAEGVYWEYRGRPLISIAHAIFAVGFAILVHKFAPRRRE